MDKFKTTKIKTFQNGGLSILGDSTIHVAYTFFTKRWSFFGQASVLGKLLMKNALIQLGRDSDALHDLKYTKYGRPYINREIDFNISHSGQFIVCAFSDCCRVGIDIEEIKSLNLSDFQNEFSLKEYAGIEKANDPMISFYDHWTAKEAVIKSDGRGMQIPLKDVRINSNSAYLHDKVYHIERIKLNNAYCCCVAFDQEIKGLNIYDAGIKPETSP